jgi:hypothetical protein
MRFKFWPTGKTKQETPEQVNAIVEPVFNALTLVIPGRYPMAMIKEVDLWVSRTRGIPMLKLQVAVNHDTFEHDQIGYVYLSPINYAILLQAMGIERTDDYGKIVGKRIAVESREKVYMDRSGYELIICGPKIVWGSKG